MRNIIYGVYEYDSSGNGFYLSYFDSEKKAMNELMSQKNRIENLRNINLKLEGLKLMSGGFCYLVIHPIVVQ